MKIDYDAHISVPGIGFGAAFNYLMGAALSQNNPKANYGKKMAALCAASLGTELALSEYRGKHDIWNLLAAGAAGGMALHAVSVGPRYAPVGALYGVPGYILTRWLLTRYAPLN